MRGLLLLVVVAACADPADPVFPADYRATYTEVRNCRQSSDHDLHRIRVMAAPDALEPYTTRASAFPVGAVVLKEEFDFADTDCSGDIIEWTVMQKTADSAHLGWHWQDVRPGRDVSTENLPRCINCHTTCGVAPDGYDGTCTVP